MKNGTATPEQIVLERNGTVRKYGEARDLQDAKKLDTKTDTATVSMTQKANVEQVQELKVMIVVV